MRGINTSHQTENAKNWAEIELGSKKDNKSTRQTKTNEYAQSEKSVFKVLHVVVYLHNGLLQHHKGLTIKAL